MWMKSPPCKSLTRLYNNFQTNFNDWCTKICGDWWYLACASLAVELMNFSFLWKINNHNSIWVAVDEYMFDVELMKFLSVNSTWVVLNENHSKDQTHESFFCGTEEIFKNQWSQHQIGSSWWKILSTLFPTHDNVWQQIGMPRSTSSGFPGIVLCGFL